MNADFLLDKTKEPGEFQVAEMLAGSAEHWNGIKIFLIENIGQVNQEWKFYGAKSGWTMKVLLGKRNLFFMKPEKSAFMVVFIFGDRAVAEVVKSNLPENIKTELLEAKKYMEGRGLRLYVKTNDDLEIVKKLVEIKVKN